MNVKIYHWILVSISVTTLMAVTPAIVKMDTAYIAMKNHVTVSQKKPRG